MATHVRGSIPRRKPAPVTSTTCRMGRCGVRRLATGYDLGAHGGHLPTRRLVLLGLAAAPVASAAPLVPTSADGLFAGRRPLAWSRAYAVPSDNPGSRWQLTFEVPPLPDDVEFVLRHEGRVLRSTSRGSDSTRWTVGFDLARPTLEEMASWLGVPLRDRRPLGEGLEATFAVTSGTGVRVTLTNGGAAPVGVVIGGRNRGPRDNQFGFAVRRDGVEVPSVEGWDFGGRSAVQPLPPGASLTRDEDVEKWAALDRPGTYDVGCSFEAQLVPGDRFPTWPDEAHQVWDARWEGDVRVVVPA
jgi:hypothetical protein